MARKKTRLQRKREKDSFKQAVKYLVLILLLLYAMVKVGLPALIKMATFIGNIRSSSEQIETEADIPLLPPRLQSLPEAVASDQIEISGFARTGDTVQLYLRGISVKETVVDKDGNFRFTQIHLREGENEIYTVAMDDKGNTSEKSKSWTVSYDSTAPSLTINQPSDGDKFFDTDSPIIISGQTDENSKLTINGRFVLVGSDGGFETSLNLSEGDNQIELVATDKADNETRKVITVNYSP